MTNKVVGAVPVGQAPQALAYVSNAVPSISAGNSAMTATDKIEAFFLTRQQQWGCNRSVSREKRCICILRRAMAAKEQQGRQPGLTQVLEASVTGLLPAHPYVLAMSDQSTGEGSLEPLAGFMTNPAGSAIVNAVGPSGRSYRAAIRRSGGIW